MLQSMYRGITMDFAEWDIQENPSLLAILQRVRTEDHGYSSLSLILRILTERLQRQLTNEELQLIHSAFSEDDKQRIQAFMDGLHFPYQALQQQLKDWAFAEQLIVSVQALDEAIDLLHLLQAGFFQQVTISASDCCFSDNRSKHSKSKGQQFYELWPFFYLATQLVISKAQAHPVLKTLAFCQCEVMPTFYAEVLWLQRTITRCVFLAPDGLSMLEQALPYLRYEQVFYLVLKSGRENLANLAHLWRTNNSVKQLFSAEQIDALNSVVTSLSEQNQE
ncbi:hypothetical protein EMM73_15220 [Rheinheimera sediminis]|uniref:hypothetical protein n=1 Tax=Rheinheimera sp. YQF-1 TaxID=2499626 RepID=UPI000FDB7A61|nr:hypothetical protein [Rheinheimera sp. YQF-1]RVT44840.1 hypothetical protein EMM73_15220 [Rheinheimera sp. YQF-1]